MGTRATAEMRWFSQQWEAGEDAAHLRDDAATQSGIVGDASHRATGGYHISRQDQPKTNYSVTRPDDRPGNGPDDAAAAVDMTYARTADLVATYGRLCEVWRNRHTHPAAKYLNAFNGWDGNGSAGRRDLVTGALSSSDSSHKWHIHLEFRRKYVTDMAAMRAVLAVLVPATSNATITGRVDMPMFVQVEGNPTIVLTDWFMFHDRTMPYERVKAMVDQGVLLVKIDNIEMARILALPGPGSPTVHPPTPSDPTGVGALSDQVTELAGQVEALSDRLSAAGSALYVD